MQEAAEAAAKEKAGNIPVENNKGGGKKGQEETTIAFKSSHIAALDNSAGKELDIKDAKTSSPEKKNEEKTSACGGDARMPASQKGNKRNVKGKKIKRWMFPW